VRVSKEVPERFWVTLFRQTKPILYFESLTVTFLD